jgi:cytochrome c oxidase assembly protein subunit 15
MAVVLGFGVICQAGLGIWTLMWATPIDLGLAHQAAAALVFGLATGFLWVARRA